MHVLSPEIAYKYC